MIAIDGPAKHGEGARQRRRRVRPVRFGPSMPRAGIGQCGASREMDCVDTTAPDSREAAEHPADQCISPAATRMAAV